MHIQMKGKGFRASLTGIPVSVGSRDAVGTPAASPPRARSSAGEHFLHTEGVTGSIPVAPTMKSSNLEAI